MVSLLLKCLVALREILPWLTPFCRRYGTLSNSRCPRSCDKQCLFGPDVALMSMLSVEDVADAPGNGVDSDGTGGEERIAPEWENFLDWYKSSERALWGKATFSFGTLVSHTMQTIQALPDDAVDGAAAFVLGLVIAAAQAGLRFDLAPILGESEGLQRTWLTDALLAIGDIPENGGPPEPRRITVAMLRQLMFPGPRVEVQRPPVGNWLLRLSEAEQELGPEVEVHVREVAAGQIEMFFTPVGPPTEDAVDSILQAISMLLSMRPGEGMYERFRHETASWSRPDADEPESVSHLGWSLQMVHGWDPSFHGAKQSSLCPPLGASCFVTRDARGVLRVATT
jgi:hypothetical protein